MVETDLMVSSCLQCLIVVLDNGQKVVCNGGYTWLITIHHSELLKEPKCVHIGFIADLLLGGVHHPLSNGSSILMIGEPMKKHYHSFATIIDEF